MKGGPISPSALLQRLISGGVEVEVKGPQGACMKPQHFEDFIPMKLKVEG